MKDVILCSEDFSDFAIGEFPYDKDHSAMGEYQYVVEDGYHGNWLDQVSNYTYNGTGPSWLITEQNGVHYMECMRIEKNHPHRTFPTLETGKKQWKNYKVSVTLRRLSQKGMAGLAVCLNHSSDTLVFALNNKGTVTAVYRHKEQVEMLKTAKFKHNCDNTYQLCVDCNGDTAQFSINGKIVLSVTSELVARGGKVGITADCPSRFGNFVVCADKQTAEDIASAEKEQQKQEAAEMRRHPKMKLWKKIDLRDFGTSRQIRFGHLKGDSSCQIVLAQMQKRVSRDAYGFISCLTAIDLDGRVLWQMGTPSDNTQQLGKVSADMPFQLYDIDNDGFDEVIVGWDFEIRILDGRTGKIKKAVKTPFSYDADSTIIGIPYNTYAFERINPDGIRICNFRGKKRPQDILIKDRYCRVYALDDELNLLWKYKSDTNTGHCPLPVDVDGDGKDELLVGYKLLDSDGSVLWSYPITDDHTDEIVAGKWMPNDDEGSFACVSGTQGFFIGDFYGNIIARDYIGHAQRVSIANYCPEREGLEIAVSNFWGHQEAIFLYDCYGNPIWEMQNEMNGNILAHELGRKRSRAYAYKCRPC